MLGSNYNRELNLRLLWKRHTTSSVSLQQGLCHGALHTWLLDLFTVIASSFPLPYPSVGAAPSLISQKGIRFRSKTSFSHGASSAFCKHIRSERNKIHRRFLLFMPELWSSAVAVVLLHPSLCVSNRRSCTRTAPTSVEHSRFGFWRTGAAACIRNWLNGGGGVKVSGF